MTWMNAGQRRFEARRRLADAQDSLRKMRREMEQHLREARAFTSPDYTPEGLAKHRQLLTDKVANHYGPQIRQLQVQIKDDVALVRSHLDGLRPTLPADASSIMRAQVRWDSVRMRLESGMPLRQILATADLDTVIAVREWGSSWLSIAAASSGSNLGAALAGEDAPQFDPKPLQRQIDDRLAALLGGDLAEALAAAREADVVEAATGPMLAHSERVLTGDESVPLISLDVAVSAAYAAQVAGAPLNEPVTDEEAGANA